MQRSFDRLVRLTAFTGEPLLDLEVQGVFNEIRGVTPVLTMSITNAKHVHWLPLLDVRRQDECILISFLWILRLKADSCSERELLDNVLRLDMGQMRRVWRCYSLLWSFKCE